MDGAATDSEQQLLAVRHDSGNSIQGGVQQGKTQPEYATVTGTVANMLKNILASAMLSLPWAFGQSSITIALIIMIITVLYSGYGFIVIARLCVYTNKYSFKEIIYCLYNQRWMCSYIQICISLYTLGTCISYLVLIGDFVPEAMDAFPSMQDSIFAQRNTTIIIFWWIFLVPLSFVTSLKKLKYFSMFGFACVMYAGGLIGEQEMAHGEINDSVSWFHLSHGLFSSIPVLAIAFSAHYNGPTFFKELGSSMPKFKLSVVYTMTIAFFLYVVVALCGYFQFGADTLSDIMQNYPNDDMLPLIARFSLSFSLATSYPFAFFSLRKNCHLLVQNHLNFFPHSKKGKLAAFGLVIGVNLVVLIISIAVPNVDVVLGYKGSLLGTQVMFIIPGLAYVTVLRRQQASSARKHSISTGDLNEVADSTAVHYRHRASSEEFVLSEASALHADNANMAPLSEVPIAKLLGPITMILWGVSSLVLGTYSTIYAQVN